MAEGEQSPRSWSRYLRTALRSALDALESLVVGLATAVLALVALLAVTATALLCLVGVGVVAVPAVLRFVRAVADRERARLTRTGTDVVGPGPVPAQPLAAIRSRATRRELVWLPLHAVAGFVLGILALAIVLNSVRDGTFPLWWYLLPPDDATPAIPLWTVHDTAGAIAVALLGVGWAFVAVPLLPVLSRLQAMPGRALLAAPDADPALRIAHLTATRAAALDAHTVELRRIERALHDGTQNRIVAMTVLLGAARRALARGAPDTDTILGEAQGVAEEALADLRAVVRSILPPVLLERSLEDALAALVAACPVPCRLDVDLPGRYAASVEASVYLVIAEALTNVAKHSGARTAAVVIRRQHDDVHVEITDDGQGGASTAGGSGLLGISRRIEAQDGTLTVISPAGGPTTLKVIVPCGL
jgi:signal transduction histidine kinase